MKQTPEGSLRYFAKSEAFAKVPVLLRKKRSVCEGSRATSQKAEPHELYQ